MGQATARRPDAERPTTLRKAFAQVTQVFRHLQVQWAVASGTGRKLRHSLNVSLSEVDKVCRADEWHRLDRPGSSTSHTLCGVAIYHEVRRRASHVARIIRAGFASLWAVVGVITIFVGGSAFLAFVWGIRHLAWGLVIALVIIILMLTEGSYRESRITIRTGESPHMKALRELSVEGQVMRARLPDKEKRGLVNLPDDLLREFEAWKSRTISALEPWPTCLSQFRGQIYYGMSLFQPDRKSLEIEHRTKILDQIVESLTSHDLG